MSKIKRTPAIEKAVRRLNAAAKDEGGRVLAIVVEIEDASPLVVYSDDGGVQRAIGYLAEGLARGWPGGSD